MKKFISVIIALVMVLCLLPPLDITTQAELRSAKKYKDLNIYFFPLNPEGDTSYTTGDSFIITIGDVEILVDAGASKKSAKIIVEKMEKVISADKVWDYIIVTHPDGDHITAFTNTSGKSVFGQFKQSADGDGEKWSLGTLIDFDITKDKTVTVEGVKDAYKSEKGYIEYALKRDEIVAACQAEYYTASECCWEQRKIETDGKERDLTKNDLRKEIRRTVTNEFDLGGGATLHILYNYFYDHLVEGGSNSSIKNNLSVCFMIKHGDNKLLFTGDLEEYATPIEHGKVTQIYGETKLLKNNQDKLSGGVTFYKAAHHGSSTSSSASFLEVIKPQYIVVSAVAGTRRYTQNIEKAFPSTSVMTNFRKYTDQIFITEMALHHKEDETRKTRAWTPHDGNITVTSNGADLTVDTDEILHTFVFDVEESIDGIGRCVLLKNGNTEILIDAGIYSSSPAQSNTVGFVNNIKDYCYDGFIEYLIVSGAQSEYLTNIIGQYKDGEPLNNGVLGEFKIGTIIDFGDNTKIKDPQANGWLAHYREQRDSYVRNSQLLCECADKSKCKCKCSYMAASTIEEPIEVDDGSAEFTIQFFNTSTSPEMKAEDDYSLVVLITFYGKKLLFMGGLTNAEKAEEILVKDHGEELKDVTVYLSGGNGRNISNSAQLMQTVKPKYSVINSNVNGKYLSNEACKRISSYTDGDNGENVFLISNVDDGSVVRDESILFSMEKKTNSNDVVVKAIQYLYLDETVETLATSSWYN